MTAEVLHTVAELAQLWRVSQNCIYDEIARGNLRKVSVGSGRAKFRIPESIADAYWQKQLDAEEKVAQATQLRSVA